MKTRIILVRHGETEWNLQGRIQGRLDSPLTEAGRRQAEAIANRLQPSSPQAIASSDLGRCMQTASIIARTIPRDVIPMKEFREKGGGIFEGYSWPEIERHFPAEYRRYREHAPGYTQPGAESWSDATARGLSGLDSVVRRYAGKRIVIVTHGGVLHAMIRNVLGIPDGAPSRIHFRNGALHTLVHEESGYSVETIGDMCHLDGETADDIESK